MSEIPPPTPPAEPQPPSAPGAPLVSAVLLTRQGATLMEKLLIADLFVAAGALLLFLGPLLPWISWSVDPGYGFGRMGGSRIGLKVGFGVVIFLMSFAAGGILAATVMSGKILKILAMALLGIGGLGALFALIDMIRTSDTYSSPSVGVFLALLGGIAVALGGLGLLLKKPFFVKKFK